MSIETLKEKAKSYNISQEYLDSKEKGRLEFLAKFFPIGWCPTYRNYFSIGWCPTYRKYYIFK
jgi:hypothetical protein